MVPVHWMMVRCAQGPVRRWNSTPPMSSWPPRRAMSGASTQRGTSRRARCCMRRLAGCWKGRSRPWATMSSTLLIFGRMTTRASCPSSASASAPYTAAARTRGASTRRRGGSARSVTEETSSAPSSPCGPWLGARSCCSAPASRRPPRPPANFLARPDEWRALPQALGVAEDQCRILTLDLPTAELAQPLHRPFLIPEAAHSHPEAALEFFDR
mmetsp:Transcript_10145/g.35511  ORF Transcript_10145/g.35511 Transcript_10145/m.35511 type:complete len:213 (+) Transcript_10145:390-1028(+)